jgi:hypothetical protein
MSAPSHARCAISSLLFPALDLFGGVFLDWELMMGRGARYDVRKLRASVPAPLGQSQVGEQTHPDMYIGLPVCVRARRGLWEAFRPRDDHQERRWRRPPPPSRRSCRVFSSPCTHFSFSRSTRERPRARPRQKEMALPPPHRLHPPGHSMPRPMFSRFSMLCSTVCYPRNPSHPLRSPGTRHRGRARPAVPRPP